MLYCVLFFKQKTAYEMRISDWSSDVCSSDLPGRTQGAQQEGFRLVVAMVGEGQYLVVAQRGCECPTPCGAGCCLQSKTGIALDVHVDHLQRNGQRLAKRAARRGPAVGGGLPAVEEDRQNGGSGKRVQGEEMSEETR